MRASFLPALMQRAADFVGAFWGYIPTRRQHSSQINSLQVGSGASSTTVQDEFLAPSRLMTDFPVAVTANGREGK
jgi:hypothetical protein